MPRHPEEHQALVRVANAWRTNVPAPPPGTGPPRATRRLQVFGVGPDWIQVTWSALGPGPVTFRCGDQRAEVLADGGPGAQLLQGVPAGSDVRVELAGGGVAEGSLDLTTRTLPLPPGEELLRFATISDVHVGSGSTGYFHTIVEIPEPEVPHPVRCLRAALDELTRWGAQHLIVKGDLVHRSEQVHWDVVGDVLAGIDLPVEVVPGNHERSKTGDVPADVALEGLGRSLVSGVRWVDRSGVRLLMADTTRPRTDIGDLTAVHDGLVAAAATTTTPVFLALHHQPMRFRFPVYLPPGIPGPQARRLFGALGEANPRIVASSGHTHRHRRYRVSGVTVSEVGSTKDFPGTWAGYHVHEGGVAQVVRRIAEPSCIRWTDHTRRAALGVWSRWAPGRLDDRCFTVTW